MTKEQGEHELEQAFAVWTKTNAYVDIHNILIRYTKDPELTDKILSITYFAGINKGMKIAGEIHTKVRD